MELLTIIAGFVGSVIIWNLGSCYRAVLNDARIIELDPALQSKLEILYAYPGEFLFELVEGAVHLHVGIICRCNSRHLGATGAGGRHQPEMFHRYTLLS